MNKKEVDLVYVRTKAALDQHKDPMPLSLLLVRRALSIRSRTRAYWDARIQSQLFVETGKKQDDA